MFFDRFFRPRNPDKDPTSLVNMLVRFDFVERTAAMKALDEKQDKLIGQCLVERKLITEDQLDEALFQQQVARGKVPAHQVIARSLERQAKMQKKIARAANALVHLTMRKA